MAKNQIQIAKEAILKLTINESRELSIELAEEYGIRILFNVQASDPYLHSYELKLLNAGGARLSIVKLIKDATNLSLLDSKTLMESAPCIIKTSNNKEDLLDLEHSLRESGAIVEIQTSIKI